jgi:hypothetical protein
MKMWRRKKKWSRVTDGSLTPRLTGRLIVGFNVTSTSIIPPGCWVEFILRPTVSRPLRIGLTFGTRDQILSHPFFNDICFVVLPVGRPLWREDWSTKLCTNICCVRRFLYLLIDTRATGCINQVREYWSLTYSAIADWSGYWGPITIHYHLIWDCVPSSSPLTIRRDYGRSPNQITSDNQSASQSWCQVNIASTLLLRVLATGIPWQVFWSSADQWFFCQL